MTQEHYGFHPPSRIKQFAEKLGIRDIQPEDVLPKEGVEIFSRKHRSFMGDSDIGHADVAGRCQDWRDNRGWWKVYVYPHNQRSVDRKSHSLRRGI